MKIKAGYTRMYPPYKHAYKRPFWSFVQGGKMKKITLICACVLLFTAVNAEQMQFVTTMSAPVGNFAHLDAADSTHVTSAPILNFCNTRSSVGKIVIKGAGAYLNQVNIQNGTTLGSTNTPEYRLGANLSIENGGTVTAGRVMANDVTFKDTNFHKSNVTNAIYGNDVAVMGGKADNMEISGTAKINKSEQNSANLGEELWWDNQYASDYDASGNKKTNGKTYTSFLLKSKTPGCDNSGESACVNSKGSWDSSSCECTCPSKMVLQNGVCLGAFKAKVIDVGVLVNCHYSPNSSMITKGREDCSDSDADPNDCYKTEEAQYTPICSGGERCCVLTYEFFQGGALIKSPKISGRDWVSERWLFWKGGTRIGGQQNRQYYSGGSMNSCPGNDYDALCNSNCKLGSEFCSYKCLISKAVPDGCPNGTYKYASGTSCNNASGTGKVLTCVANN